MKLEEIEELKEFTIDLTNIDELALGLEVCSKKSNMVIQELIDTIIQLQQENQELKKENKILRENAEHNDKVVDKVNWENLKLKYNWNKLRETLKNEQLGSILYSDRTRFANIDEILDKMQELESSDSNDI